MTRYELIERIGVGAMAEIFRGRAVAAGGFEKPVAIKRILPHLGQDRRFVEALMAEAKILSQLRHRNIVQIFDVGLGDDGQYFLVMEFVDGMNLGAVQQTLEARRKRLPLDIALHVGAEICEALEHAHNAVAPDGKPMRLVHRDIAPSNVLVSRHGEVKLTDFGLARRPDEATGHGGVRSKYGYLSPEAAAGVPVDSRSDVFSTAALVYELTLGRRLFSHLPDLEAMRAVQDCNVPRPRDIDRTLPSALDDILMSALVKERARRVATAGELGAKLRSLRYSLEQAAGDPSQELARIVVGVENAADAPADASAPADARKAAGRRRRNPASSAAPFAAEPTVVRLTSIDPFGDDRDGTGLIKARAVLDRFEEEETRLASSPGIAAGAGDGRWRQSLDSEEIPLGRGGVRETAPTGIFIGERVPGDNETGEVNFTGQPRALTEDAEESTKVLSPAQLARRATDVAASASAGRSPADPTKMIHRGKPMPGKLATPTPPSLPGLSRNKPAPSSPPPLPPVRAAGGSPAPLRIEAKVPARTATPTVAEPPGSSSREEPRMPSMPVVAGFDRGGQPGGSRLWLIIAAIAVMILAAGIAAALLR